MFRLFVRGVFPVRGVSLVVRRGEGGALCSDSVLVGRTGVAGHSFRTRGVLSSWVWARVARGLFARDRRGVML